MFRKKSKKDRVECLRRSRPRFLTWGLVFACGIVLAAAAVIGLFGDAIVNRFGKEKLEHAFAERHPGSELRIGQLRYRCRSNRLLADSVALRTTNATVTVESISISGVRWRKVLWGKSELADALIKAGLKATRLEAQFANAECRILCAKLQTSVPDSEIVAEGAELKPMQDEKEFLAKHALRATRYYVVVPGCRISGVDFKELLRGTSFRAKDVHIFGPTFDALVNRDKPLPAFTSQPLMVHEALAKIPKLLVIDNLEATNGLITYRERVLAGAEPGVLTFGKVSVKAENISNRAAPGSAIRVKAQGDLMNSGTLNIIMSIPIQPPTFSMQYSGSLTSMNLTHLNDFLDFAEHMRVKSGTTEGTEFEITVDDGVARGTVRAIYSNLEIALLDKESGKEELADKARSFLVNAFKIRNDNSPDKPDSMKEGKVSYIKKPEEEFMKFLWVALRTGVLDVISH